MATITMVDILAYKDHLMISGRARSAQTFQPGHYADLHCQHQRGNEVEERAGGVA